jgi:hypothetical protein
VARRKNLFWANGSRTQEMSGYKMALLRFVRFLQQAEREKAEEKKKRVGMGPFQEQSGLVFNEQKCSNVRNLTAVVSCCDSIHTVT